MRENAPSPRYIRNIGVLAHVDAGKTTATEQMLYVCGNIRKPGSVDQGTTRTDSLPEERARGITIKAAAVALAWRDHSIHLIDTPGHSDFATEVQHALSVLDGAVLLVSAADGVQPHTERLWRYLSGLQVPIVILLNKMDQVVDGGAATLEEVRDVLTARAVPIQVPHGVGRGFTGTVDPIRGIKTVWRSGDARAMRREAAQVPDREQLTVAIAEVDEALADRFLRDQPVSEAHLMAALARAVKARSVFPVLYAAMAQGVGAQPLLDAIVDLLPPPNGSTAAPFAGQVFKVERHPVAGKVAHVRVRDGILRNRDIVRNATRGVEDTVTQIRNLGGGSNTDIGQASAGQVVAVLGLASVKCGDTLGAEVSRPREPLLTSVITARLRSAEGIRPDQLLSALSELEDEDPDLAAQWSPLDREVLVAVRGPVHVEFLASTLRSRFGMEVTIDRPTAQFLETIETPCSGSARYTGPLGDHNHFAEVDVGLRPLPRGTGIRIVSSVQGAPSAFVMGAQNAVPEALRAAGPLRGRPVTDVQVEILAYRYDRRSGSGDFHHATIAAIRSALSHCARPLLLEPVLDFDLFAPESQGARVVAHLCGRGATIELVERAGARTHVHGEIPAAATWDLPVEIASLTGGRGL